jgi:peptide/nickel transport system permease protein
VPIAVNAALQFFRRTTSLLVGSLVLAAVLLGIVLVPIFLRANPVLMDMARPLLQPSWTVLFGTDDLGRDLLSRVLHGGRTSLLIGLEVMILTGLFGTAIGLVTGYFERVDLVVMRLMDILMAFPSLLLAIAILTIMPGNPLGVVIALSVVYTPRTVRVVRSVVLSTAEEGYVEAARAVGVPTRKILVRHILPGVIPSLVVQETFLFAYAILGEAGLSFVGVGIQPPLPSWGNIMGDARALLREAPWLLFFPGMGIMLTVLSLNLIGDGLRDALDPKRARL